MSAMANPAFNASLVSFIDVSSVEEVETLMSSMLCDQGFVEPSFKDALLEREANFPTALSLGTYGVAIPHTEGEHTKQGAIALGILKNPVTWKRMDDPDESCPVRLVIMLALQDPHDHLEMLQRVISLVQNHDLINQVLEQSDAQRVADQVTPTLLG